MHKAHRRNRLGQAEDKRRAAEAGFDRHLVKPVDPRELAKLLSSAEVFVHAELALQY